MCLNPKNPPQVEFQMVLEALGQEIEETLVKIASNSVHQMEAHSADSLQANTYLWFNWHVGHIHRAYFWMFRISGTLWIYLPAMVICSAMFFGGMKQQTGNQHVVCAKHAGSMRATRWVHEFMRFTLTLVQLPSTPSKNPKKSRKNRLSWALYHWEESELLIAKCFHHNIDEFLIEWNVDNMCVELSLNRFSFHHLPLTSIQNN